MGIGKGNRNRMWPVRDRICRCNDVVYRIECRRHKLPVYIKIGSLSVCGRCDLKVRRVVSRVVVRIADTCIRLIRHVRSIGSIRSMRFFIIAPECKCQTAQRNRPQNIRVPLIFRILTVISQTLVRDIPIIQI